MLKSSQIKIIVLLVICALSTSTIDAFFIMATGDWKHYSYDEKHSGYVNTTIDQILFPWVINLGLDQASSNGQPIICNGRLYVTNYKTLYSIDINSGKVLWNYSDGDFINRHICIDNDIIVISMWNRYLYGINVDGNLKWKTYIAECGSPTIYQDNVYVGGSLGLYQVDLNSGAIKKHFPTPFPSGFPSIMDNNIIFGTSKPCDIYSINIDTFTLNWIYPTGFDYIIDSPVIYNDIIFISTMKITDDGLSDFGDITALTKYGTAIWNYTSDSIFTKPSVANGRIFFGMMDRSNYKRDDLMILALNTTDGKKLWSFHGKSHTSPTLSNTNLYVAISPHRLICINQTTGELLWEYGSNYTDYWVCTSSSPAISNNSIFIGAIGGQMLRFTSQRYSHSQHNEQTIIDKIFNRLLSPIGFIIWCISSYIGGIVLASKYRVC